jgi:hypothetical protein
VGTRDRKRYRFALFMAGALALPAVIAAAPDAARAAGSISVTNPGTLNSYEGDYVYLPLHATDSAPGAVLSYASSTLPAGLAINGASGVISGQLTLGPNLGGLGYQSLIIVSDNEGASTAIDVNWNVINNFTDVPVGPVRSGYAGKCLNDTKSRTTNGNPIQLWTCNGGADQDVTWTGSQLMIAGKCVTDPGGSATTGTVIRLEPCGANSTMLPWMGGLQFFPSEIGAGCLDAPHSAAGSTLVLGDCPLIPGTPIPAGLRWSAPGTPVILGLDDKCLDNPNLMNAGTAKADLQACTALNTQNVSLWPLGSGPNGEPWYQVTTTNTTLCLTVQGGGTKSGTKVVWTGCDASRTSALALGQFWEFGSGMLANPRSGKCLTDPASRTANGTQLDIGTCTGKSNQQWSTPPSPIYSELPGYCLADSPRGRQRPAPR